MTLTERQAGWLVLAVAGLIGVGMASPRALGWNDGSRLAAVESLVERGTWAIDDSPFVSIPGIDPRSGAIRPTPYPADDPFLTAGTLDKLWIDGHFYSDKSPLPALPLAGVYALLRAAGLPPVADAPEWFCWVLCLASSGAAYVVAIWCVWRMGVPLGLALRPRLLLTAAFGLATLAWPYSRVVNNHLMLLAVAAALWLELAWLLRGPEESTGWRFARLGLLSGLAYTIDLGAGPPLAALAFVLACWRGRLAGACKRSARLAALFVACALPAVLLHHGLNYAVGGTWKPANAVPEYLAWPGSPFHAGNMTGQWAHAGPGAFAVYALDLLFGKKGFLLHNLPLLAGLVALPIVFARARRERPELVVAVLMGLGVWLVYAAGSTNHSGGCISIRWFVPLLAPGFFALALALRDRPELDRQLAVLTVGGFVLSALAAWAGPWSLRMVPGYWFVVGATLLAWIASLRVTPLSAALASGR